MKTELWFTGPEIELLRSAFGAGRHREDLRGNFKTAPPVLNENPGRYHADFSPKKSETSWITEIGPVFASTWRSVDISSTPNLNYMRKNYEGVGVIHYTQFKVDVDVDFTNEACLKGLSVEDVVLEAALSRMLRLLDDMGDTWHRSWSPTTHLISDYRRDPWSSHNYHDGYIDRYAEPHSLWKGTATSPESKYKILSDLCNWWFWTSAREMYRVLLRDFGEIFVGPIRYEMLHGYMGHLGSGRVVEDFLNPELSPNLSDKYGEFIHGNDNAYLFRLNIILMSYLAYDWFIARDVIAREGFAEWRYPREGHRELVHNVFAAMGLQAMLADFAKDWWTTLDQFSSSTVITNSALERALLHCVICGVGLTEDETLRDSLMCIFCDWEHKLRNEFRENAFLLERAKAEIASEEYRRGFDL